MAEERVARPRLRATFRGTRSASRRSLCRCATSSLTDCLREIAAARDLTRDQRELVVDDAIDYMVTQYAKPLIAHDQLDRAFWASASFRVKRTHEGRAATVRGRLPARCAR